MALLNPPDILPEAMRFLLRALLTLREPEVDRDELVGLVAPRGLTEAMDSVGSDASGDESDDDLRTGGTVIVVASLDALRMFGLVKQDGSRVALDRAAAQRWRSPADLSPRSLCQFLLDQVQQTADPDASQGVTDFVQAMSLLHAAGQPLRPFDRFESVGSAAGRGFASRQLEILGDDRKVWPVPNKEQWMSFRRWASYFGLARPAGATGLIPDASEALGRRLLSLAPGDYDVREFLARCSSAVPILDDGALVPFGHDPQPEGDHAVLSGGFSVSLLQLEADGFLRLDKRSDTGGRTIRLRPDGSADRLVTTVVWERTAVRRGHG